MRLWFALGQKRQGNLRWRATGFLLHTATETIIKVKMFSGYTGIIKELRDPSKWE